MPSGLTSAPVNTVPTDIVRYEEGDDVPFPGTIQVADVDGGTLTVSLRIGSGYGSLTIDPAYDGLISSGSNGDDSIELTGSAGELNAALASLVFSPAQDDTDTIYIETSDGQRSDDDQIVVAPFSESSAEPPVNTTPTQTLRISPDGTYVFDGNFSVGDPNDDVLTVTLNGDGGTITLNFDPDAPGDLDVSGNGSDDVTLTGSVADINAALDGLEYRHDSEAGGPFDDITVVTTDGDYTDKDQIHFNVADLTADSATEEFRDTLRDDAFVPATGTLSSTGNDPVFSLAGSTASTLPGYDRKVVGTYGTLHLDAATGAYAYVPLDSAIESLRTRVTESFSVTVTDGEDTTTAAIEIDLRGVNDRPELAASVTAASYADTAGDDTFATTSGQLTGIDRDAGDDLAYGVLGGSPVPGLAGDEVLKTGAYGTLYVDTRTGAYRFEPDEAAIEGLKRSASQTFTLTATDESGAVATQAFKVTLTGADDNPEVTATLPGAAYADTGADDDVAVARGRLLASDRDAGDTLAYDIAGRTAVSDRSGYDIAKAGAYGTLYLNSGTGAYLFVPSDAAIEALKADASEDFTLTASDGGGEAARQTFTIDVDGANDRPLLDATLLSARFTDTPGDDAVSPVSGQLTAEDRDAGDIPTFDIAGGAASTNRPGFDLAKAGAFGILHLNSVTGAYLFVPSDAAVEGLHDAARETFTVLVRDGSGATDSRTFTVNLAGANDRPEGGADGYAVGAGETLAVARLSGVLANDSDRDDGTLEAQLVSGPRHGTLTLNPNGSFTYRPDAGYSGADGFVYRAGDGAAQSAPVRVAITVEPGGEPENRPPVAVADGVTVTEDATSLAARIVAGSVLSNDADPNSGDTLTVTALDGRTLGARLVVEGIFGTLTLEADGSYSYAYANTDALIAGESGRDRFSYEVSDGHGGTDIAVLTFTVDGADLRLVESGTFVAHRGADAITGMDTADRIAGRRGDDLLKGEDGNDTLWGEEGDDRILGGGGRDQGIGGLGNDTLSMGEGDDRAWGQGGEDVIRGEGGDDRMDGGSGDDAIDFGSGDDRGWGSGGDDSLVGGLGADRLNGGSGQDVLSGGGEDDDLWGGDGADLLDGGTGDDALSGGAGNDVLLMGSGDDAAYGGGGNDRFVFSAGFGRDVLKDFDVGDRIVFDGVFSSFAQVQAALRQEGGDTIIEGPGGSTITIENVARLTAADVLFL